MSAMAFVGLVKDANAARQLAAELKNERRHEFVASQRRAGCTRERMFLGASPNGPLMMIYREGTNAGMHLARLMASQNTFDRYYLENIERIAGVSVASLPVGPPPHLAFEWTNGERARNCTMIAAPVPDVTKFWKFCREISGRPAEHAESRQRHGIAFEQVFYLHDAKMAVVYLEGTDPHAALGRMMESTSAYDRFFAEQLTAVHGFDLKSQPMKQPELLVLFDA